MSEFVFLFRASDPARQAAMGTPERRSGACKRGWRGYASSKPRGT